MILILIESVKTHGWDLDVAHRKSPGNESVSYWEREIRRAPSKRLTQ
jgi:hypothetical protein